MKATGNGYTLTYSADEAGYMLETLTGNGVDLTLDLVLPVRARTAAALLGARGGAATLGVTSEAKARTSAENGKRGGRPVGSGKKK